MGLEFILWLQSFSTPLLDRVVIAITTLGDEEFFMLAAALILWLGNKRTGFWAVFLLIFSSWLNGWLKHLFGVPRPDPAVVRVIHPAEGLSFPSGHAQSTATFWGYLAVTFRRRPLTLAAAVIIVLVALSRPYLGVHYLTDVVAGTLIGLAVVVAFLAVRHQAAIARLPRRLGWAGQLCCAAILPLGLLLVFAGPDGVKLTGFMVGAAVGHLLELRLVRFDPRGTALQHVIKVVVGVAVLFGLRTGLKALFPDLAFFHFLRYALVAFWGLFLAPLCFVALRLAGRESLGAQPPAFSA